MVALVSVETVLLVLLVVLVAALLRSHAEILRRLGPGTADEERLSGVAGQARLPEPPAANRADTTAPEVGGVTPNGDALKLAFGREPTLLAFLSSSCTSCAGFWEALRDRRPAPGLRTLIVTRGLDREQRVKLRALAPERVPVVMSSEAWEDYAVPGSPYFVLVEDGEIRGEGVATTWDALSSLVTDALEDQRDAHTIDERMAAAGIAPGHPSLYPGGDR